MTVPHRRALAFYGASETREAPPTLSTGEAAFREAIPLRRRAADAYRNDPLLFNATRVLRSGLLGHPYPLIDDENATEWWYRWADSCGYQHLHGSLSAILRIIAHHLIQDGECFVQRVWTGAKSRPNPLLLAVWPKRLVERSRGHNNTGHEYADGLWSGTWFQARSVEPNGQRYSPVLIPSADLIWCRYIYEGDQVEGLPRFHAALESAEQLGSYAQTALVQARVAACTSAFVIAEDSIFGPEVELGTSITDVDGNVLQDLHPGAIPIVHGAKDVKSVVPTQSAGFSVADHTARVAAGTGMLSETISGSMGSASFSAARHAGLVRDEVVEEALIDFEPVREGIVTWWRQAEALMGRDWSGVTIEWLPRPTPAIDPQKQAAADEIQVRLGIKSRRQCVEERGRDPKKVFAEIMEERSMFGEPQADDRSTDSASTEEEDEAGNAVARGRLVAA